MQESKHTTVTAILKIPLKPLLAMLVSGCASRPVNDRIDQVDPNSGYWPQLLMSARENNDPSTFLVLSFSGGGTRAAALSYGVLEELNRYKYTVEGKQRSLLDEIDVITSNCANLMLSLLGA